MSAGKAIAAALIGLVALPVMALPVMARPFEGPARAADPPPLGDPPPLLDDAAYDTMFVCPESLPSDEARRQAMVAFFHWAQARHPDWSLAETVEFKKTLLVRHDCAASLRDLADYAKREYR
jgi:hypothetical protein